MVFSARYDGSLRQVIMCVILTASDKEQRKQNRDRQNKERQNRYRWTNRRKDRVLFTIL